MILSDNFGTKSQLQIRWIILSKHSARKLDSDSRLPFFVQIDACPFVILGEEELLQIESNRKATHNPGIQEALLLITFWIPDRVRNDR